MVSRTQLTSSRFPNMEVFEVVTTSSFPGFVFTWHSGVLTRELHAPSAAHALLTVLLVLAGVSEYKIGECLRTFSLSVLRLTVASAQAPFLVLSTVPQFTLFLAKTGSVLCSMGHSHCLPRPLRASPVTPSLWEAGSSFIWEDPTALSYRTQAHAAVELAALVMIQVSY